MSTTKTTRQGYTIMVPNADYEIMQSEIDELRAELQIVTAERDAFMASLDRGMAEHKRVLAENARLRDALKKANDQAESFERLWYLRGYALEAAIEALDWLPTCERITCRCNSLWDRQQKAIEAARAALGEKS